MYFTIIQNNHNIILFSDARTDIIIMVHANENIGVNNKHVPLWRWERCGVGGC